MEKVGRMRDAWIALATGSGAVGLGDKQAVAREEGEGAFAPLGLLTPHPVLLGVVWSGRGVPAAGLSFLCCERGK